jgi:hypothetical protein
VLGLGQAVPRWGAIDFSVQSGDVMHFDDSRGIGEPFYQAKEPAATAVAAENAAAEAAARAKADAAKAAGAGSGAAPAPTTPPVQRAGPDGTDHRTADSLLPGRSPVVQRCGTERHEGCPCMDDNRDASTTTKPVQAGSTGPTAQKTVRPESPDAALLPVEREEAETPKIDFPTSEETTTTKSSFTGDSAPHERTPHRVLSWEADTCCTNLGYPDPSATRRTRTGASCCNTHPRFVDAEAKRQGFDGAASCNPDHRGHTATVTPYGKGKVAVEVVCADTRRRHNDPEKRDTIELGFAPAFKAYGEPSVRSRGEVAYGPAVPSLCDKVVTECDKNENPHEGQCLEEGCTTATTGTKGKPKNK